MLTGVHETLRSSGLPLRLEAPDDPHLDERLDELRACAREAGAAQLLSFLESPPGPEALLDLSDFRSLDGVDDATRAVERAALEALAVRDRSELQELLLAYDRAYRAAKDRESALDFGETFQPLAAAGRFPDPAFGPAVELLVTDKDSYKDTGTHWRAAEARHIARRVRELVDSGEAEPGEVVLLFAAGTDARLYEEELRAAGLPTFRATGRDYYHQQQVVDLLAYLRLLHNRYDDEALVSVLASPFVGVSNDGLVFLRRAAPKRPLYAGIEKGVDGLTARDARLFQAFRQRFDRLAAQASSSTLARLCEQIVCEHDYDLAVLAQWDGRRRYANLRKLARLARSFEELRGPDVEGFVRF